MFSVINFYAIPVFKSNGVLQQFLVLGRPIVKRLTLCYHTVVCLSCRVCLSVLSFCDIGVLWPNGWMDQDETWHAGRRRA